MASQGDVTGIELSFGSFLLNTSLVSLHIYLCVHAFVKYRESTLVVRNTRINYNNGRTKESSSTALYLDVLFHLFIGVTHLTADGLLAWRCYVIWTGNKWVGLFPLLPYVASIAVGTLNAVSNALCPGLDPTNVVCKNHGLHSGLYYLVATSVNLTATALICIRLLRTRRWLKRVLGSEGASNSDDAATTERVGDSVVPYTRVTTVLIESALPFTLLGVAAAIVAFVNTSPANYARIFSSRLWTIASGLTSQVIIYRVITGTSWTSNRERDRYALSHSINFLHTSSSSARSGIQNNVP
ncbi:hypothetical protein BKA70DRAFT_1521501 [Coprinopsis sp. MPI-PUGE-AT-0042]|nr:hypothetical protein BKA70DRAFT_1521501 [Coprinopsis sp. MPI-PUGE-AT-0042]